MVTAMVGMAMVAISQLNDALGRYMKHRLPAPQVDPGTLRPVGLAVFLLVLTSVSGHANAQTADTTALSSASKPSFSVVPRVSVSETLTDNVRLSTNDRQSEFVTTISPGIRMSADRGRLKAYLDYALNGSYYAQGTSAARLQNALTAFGTLEAVDNWAFIDASAGISQQSVSPFGVQSTGAASINANQSESATVRLSPYLRGRLANTVDYETRYSLTSNRNSGVAGSDVTIRDGSVRLGGRGAGERLSWSADAAQQSTTFSAGRATESDQFKLGLAYAVFPQLSVSVSAGQESNNFTTADKQSSGTFGYGVSWIPSERTRLSASRETRQFGDSFSVIASYRTPRTTWQFTDSKTIASPVGQNGLVNLGSAFDVFFDQFASVEPDPIKRTVLVNNFLLANGLDPTSRVTSNFAVSAVSLLRRQDLSFSLLGIRDTVTFILTRSESSRLDTVSLAVDSLSNSAVVRQSGLSVSYAHRLTPDSSLNVLALLQQSSDSLGLVDSNSRSVNLSFSTKLGAKSTAVVSGRRVIFESSANPYTESAITGTLNVQF
jgi:uncharacterized protein (PEP-CTERM system associated)